MRAIVCTDYGPLAGRIISVRNYTNDEDDKRGLNRIEYLRPIPPDDPGFALMTNALSLHRHRKRKGAEAAA